MKSLIFSVLLLVVLLFACTGEQNIVTISDRNIEVNGEAYFIKGVCYHPVPKGSDQRNFENLKEDLRLMNDAGINTIRLYSPVDDVSVLDQIHKAGIKVIVGFGYNQNGYYDILSGSFTDYIRKFQSHPAILFWELGNEYNYHPEWFDGDLINWYEALNAAAGQIRQIDALHPVGTAHGELPDSLALANCSNIDIWGINVYRWDAPGSIFTQWQEISEKPMYLSEAGADSYMTVATDKYTEGSNERAQADAVRNILNDVFTNREVCSGVAVFAFVDEFWKAGNNDVQDPGGWAPNSSGVPYDGAPNEEYWGIMTIDRTPKQAYDVVRNHYRIGN